MIKNLEKKLKFIELIDKMKEIERAVLLRSWKQESDADHSWHLAMMVLSFTEDFPKLNIEKCLKFALIHDLVEIYAWDTVALDVENEKTKKQREEDALNRLDSEFWDILSEIIDLIKSYELQDCEEAKFVQSLDKLHPIIQSVIDKGKTWNYFKYDFEKIKARQFSRVHPWFGIEKILERYLKIAEKENIIYRENKK